MSENDSVSSQDIPALLRTLGTLALAAAMAVAIKWFISLDKTENAEDKEIQCNQDIIEDGQSARDDPKAYEETQETIIKEPQVSDDQGMTVLGFDCFLDGLLKSLPDSSCLNVSVKEDGECLTDHQNLLDDLTPVSCELNCVADPQTTSDNSWGANVSISGLSAVIVDEKTNDTQNQVFSSCFTQTYEKTLYERSQEQQLDTGTISCNGECTDVMNVKYLGCQSQPTGDENLVTGICLNHRTVNMGLDEDLFDKDTCENNENFNCDSEINTTTHTKPCVENKDNISGSFSEMNPEDDTKVHLRKRKNLLNTCAPGLPESQETVNVFQSSYNVLSHEVLTRCDNTEQKTIYTTFNMQDIFQAVDIIQEAKPTTITVPNEDTILTNTLCKGHSQDEKFNLKLINHDTCTQQNIEHKIYVTYGEVLEEANNNLKSSSIESIPASAHVPNNPMDMKEKNGKLFSSVRTLHKNQNEKQDQIAGGSQIHMELCSPEAGVMDENKNNTTIHHHTNHVLQWNTTTVYNSREYIDLMYPLNVHASTNSITPLIEKDKDQFHIENNVSPSTEKSMSVCKEREYSKLHTDVGNSIESSTSHNITHGRPVAGTITTNVLCDPSTLNTFGSTMVTKTEIQSIKSTSNGQNNDVIYNWHKHDANFLTMDKNFCTVITNGYFSRYQKQVDTNFGCPSEKYNLEDCFGKHQQTTISKPMTNFLQDPGTLAEDSSFRSQSLCSDNHTASYVMVDMSRNELECQQTFYLQAIKKDSNLCKENKTVGRVEETSKSADSLESPAEYLGLSNLDNTDFISSDACFVLGSVTSCKSSPSHNERVQSVQTRDQETMNTVQSAQSFSRERIMSTIADTPELILPEYQSMYTSERKKPLMTKSCDNIYSGPSCRGSTIKNKAQSMLCLLTEYYTTKLHSEENGPLEKVARGCFIRIPKGFQNIREGVRFQLTLGNCLELLKLARKNSVPDLLKAVYILISDNYLNVLKNSAIYGQLTGLERERILQLRMRGKLSLCIIETQSIFGLNNNINRSEDMSPDQPKNKIYSLNMESNKWKQVTDIPEEACLKGCSICSMHNYLFIAGGIQKTKNGLLCSNKLFCYNPLTDIWTQLSPMNQARSQLKLVPLDGYLYAIGGECLHTVERYDLRSNKWTFAASLPKGSFAVAHEAAACGGEIYISGGHLFYRLLKYNPVRDLWEECPFNASKGRSCDMVSVGHILYRFDMHKDSTVHIFKYNTTAKVWSEYATTLPNSKVPFRCAVLDGTIYCLNREMTARFSVEEEKATFESAVFSKVPTKGIGYPCPVVLTLQGSLPQTSV